MFLDLYLYELFALLESFLEIFNYIYDGVSHKWASKIHSFKVVLLRIEGRLIEKYEHTKL